LEKVNLESQKDKSTFIGLLRGGGRKADRQAGRQAGRIFSSGGQRRRKRYNWTSSGAEQSRGSNARKPPVKRAGITLLH